MSGNPALRLITAVALVSSAWAQDKPELPVYFHQSYGPGNDKFTGKPSLDSTAKQCTSAKPTTSPSAMSGMSPPLDFL